MTAPAPLAPALAVALGALPAVAGAGCETIRDEAGAWQPIEGDIGSRPEAAFSHGMCPGCLSRWRAELLAEGGQTAG